MIYIVNYGDSVDMIAAETGSTAEDLIYTNQLVYPYPLAVGQALFIPEEGDAQRRKAVAGGYAYPYISRWVMQQTLPFLSELYVFSYGFTMQGDLVPPQVSDAMILEESAAYPVRPILTLTPLDQNGQFNNRLISAVVWDPAARGKLIAQLLAVMEEKGYQGVDIDFEYIRAQDREAFTAFVRDLAWWLHQRGYQCSVALAPKTSADQPGLLYEGKDYAAIGEAADAVLLMTYEWGYKHGPDMPVAPLNMVRRVVEYAVTEIPPEKIGLGIPNYGYDWALPFVRGRTVARTIGNVEAVQIAVRHDAQIRFDEEAQSPWFWYWENGVQHEVWFEDVRSIQAKFNLVKEFGLRGMGYWQLMRWWRANWMLAEQNFQIEQR